MTKDTEALQRRSAEPSDGEIYSLASFGGDANAKARFVAGLIEKVEQAPATPASDVAPVGEGNAKLTLSFDPSDIHRVHVWPPHPQSVDPVAGEALRDALVSAACDGIADDYMTSEKHHPGYVLIPSAKFEAILAALKGPAA